MTGKASQHFDSVQSIGICELVDGENETILKVYSSFEDALTQGVPKEIAAIVFAAIAGKAPGACLNRPGRPSPGNFDCASAGCTGICHVMSYPRGPVPSNPKPTDEGVGPIAMAKGRFYWCSCV